MATSSDRRKYGDFLFRVKVVLDAVSWATGARPASVAAGLLGAAVLTVAAGSAALTSLLTRSKAAAPEADGAFAFDSASAAAASGFPSLASAGPALYHPGAGPAPASGRWSARGLPQGGAWPGGSGGASSASAAPRRTPAADARDDDEGGPISERGGGYGARRPGSARSEETRRGEPPPTPAADAEQTAPAAAFQAAGSGGSAPSAGAAAGSGAFAGDASARAPRAGADQAGGRQGGSDGVRPEGVRIPPVDTGHAVAGQKGRPSERDARVLTRDQAFEAETAQPGTPGLRADAERLKAATESVAGESASTIRLDPSKSRDLTDGRGVHRGIPDPKLPADANPTAAAE